MHWFNRYQSVDEEKGPKDGEIRIKNVFAWWPIRIKNQKIWLETYEILQVYRIIEQKVKIGDENVTFMPGNWINLTKRCK